MSIEEPNSSLNQKIEESTLRIKNTLKSRFLRPEGVESVRKDAIREFTKLVNPSFAERRLIEIETEILGEMAGNKKD